MDIKQKRQLIIRDIEEIIGLDELDKLLENGTKLKHYIGFEISGRIHLGTGLMCMQKIKDFINAGVDCRIFLADWHAWINNKLDGSRETIKKVAVGYFKEGMQQCYKIVGGNPKDLKFVLGTDLYHNNDKYWQTFIDISKNLTLSRVKKSITIMGREAGGSVPFAWLIYPPMQIADIFIQEVNLAHAGMDQRKAHVIAREAATKLKISPLKDKQGRVIKPIVVHHHLILGLNKPPKWPVDKENLREVWSAMKMSKSKPNSAVFIDDTGDDIKKKINKAFCPEGEIEFNPILDWTKHIIFVNSPKGISIKREEKHGGNINYADYNELEKDFKDKKLHPQDLKNFVADWLVEFLRPIREHFNKGKAREMKNELEKINSPSKITKVKKHIKHINYKNIF